MPRRLYLDDAAATQLDPRVQQAMEPYWQTTYGNPASLHREGVAAQQAVALSRKSLAECLEAHADEIIFTGSGTEANNLALFGAAGMQTEKRHLVISAIEHPSVSEAARMLERRGFSVTRVPVTSSGLIEVDEFAAALRPDTFLASVIFANNEIGTIQPIAELGKLCQKRGILFHTDACQAAPWLPLRVEALHIDLLTANAAKMHGPKGIGLLYVRRRVRLEPLIVGGGQEQGLRSGTENVPAIVGFAEAFRLARERFREGTAVAQIRDQLIDGLLVLPNVHLNGDRMKRLPNNVNVSVTGVAGETLVLMLDAAGIAVSSGSACSALHEAGSPVLAAIGGSDAGNVRFSLDRKTLKKDIPRVVAAVEKIIQQQRPLQAVWNSAMAQGRSKHVTHA